MTLIQAERVFTERLRLYMRIWGPMGVNLNITDKSKNNDFI